MNLKLKNKLFLSMTLCAFIAHAQTDQHKFRRPLSDVREKWHKLQIPSDLYKNGVTGFEDIRILGIKEKDTIEVPYLVKSRTDQINNTEVNFKLINQSANNDGYYYTFQSPGGLNTINEIDLKFKQDNFDWTARLQGSNDNKEWFSILKDYRILSIKNNNTDYQFSKLNFPNSKYVYFRLNLKSPVQPQLISANISETDTIKGVYQEIKYNSYRSRNDASAKESIIDIGFQEPFPVSYLKVNVQSAYDFYRSMKIEYVTDSFSTDKGMQYNYSPLYQGTITSLQKSVFQFNNTITARLRITIQNNNNMPLAITSVEVKGNIYEIIARFDKPGYTYALYYGSKSAYAPDYEIKNFEDQIPAQLKPIKIGMEENNPSYALKISRPLF